MKLTIKTLKQEIFKIDAEENETVQNLKDKLETASNKQLPANRMNLIYSGSILEDDKSLIQYNIDEKKFLVVMIRPNKETTTTTTIIQPPTTPVNNNINNNSNSIGQREPNVVETQQTMLSSSQHQQSQQPIFHQLQTPISSTVTTATTATELQIREFHASESLTDPIEIEIAVSNIMNAMGFSREEVQQAFQVSFNNPDRAVEYLLHGIPGTILENTETTDSTSYLPSLSEQYLQQQQQQQHLQQTYLSGDSTTNVTHLLAPDGTNGPIGSQYNLPNEMQQQQQQQQQNILRPETGEINASPLSFLRDDPRFQQMRLMLQQNPELIEFVIAQIAESNVALLDLIRQNQEDFVEMINEPITAYDNNNFNEDDYQSIEVDISPDDWNAIVRLRELGFSEAECIEAYFSCERNEEVAANYLLSRFETEEN